MYRRHGSQILLQLSAAGPTNRPQPKVIKSIIMKSIKLWPAVGCEAKARADFGSRPYFLSKKYAGWLVDVKSSFASGAPGKKICIVTIDEWQS